MKILRIFYCYVLLLLLALLLIACTDDSNRVSNTDTSKDNLITSKAKESNDNEESSKADEKELELESAADTEEFVTEKPNKIYTETKDTHLNNANENGRVNPLAKYSSKEIEYARIWLQLGPNQEIDGLYIRHIPAGTPLNPDDETSVNYPENVTQLSGSRLVDGSVTYSSNGDGTINRYLAIPLRWDGVYPAGKKEYTNILKNKKRVKVDIGNNEKIIEIINKMNK